MNKKCELCRFACKSDNPPKDCKFIPKECFMGFPIHFKDDPTKLVRKRDSTSRICVVCKNYFNYKKIKWLQGSKGGLYSFCPECAKRHNWICQNVPIGMA